MALLEYDPRQTLFHYCSPSGFEGILKSKVLWFNDLSQMNDPRELELGFEHIMEALKSVRHNEYQGSRGFFLSILAGRLASVRESFQAFCCCFSLKGDDLPLWKEYTNHSGLAIGFRPTAVKDIHARVQKADYIKDTTPAAFREKVLEIAEPHDPEVDFPDEPFWTNASVAVFAAITALKHQSWSYEREVRMIHIQRRSVTDPSSGALSPEDPTDEWITPSIRSSVRGEVQYLSLEFGRYREKDKKHVNAIEKVIIGPRCPLTKARVSRMLAEYGFEGVEVFESECRIR